MADEALALVSERLKALTMGREWQRETDSPQAAEQLPMLLP